MRLGQTYLLVLEGFLWTRGATMAHWGDKDTGGGSSGMYSLAWALLEAAIFLPGPDPTQQHVGSSAGMPQAKWLKGWQHIPTYQQVGCLESSWAHRCPLNTPLNMAQHTRGTKPSSTHNWGRNSPSHQETCTNLLDSLIHQRAERRSKDNYNHAACGRETAITES